jgi:hypothetical protein
MEISKEIDTLRQMAVPELVQRYRELFGREPRVRHKEWLWKRVCWKIQEKRFGGLSVAAKNRLEELIAEIDLPVAERHRTVSGKLNGKRRPKDLAVGTILVRQWRGEELRLTVVENGFSLNGVIYSSLSSAARAASGARWNGPLFWGLTSRRRKE